MKIATWNVNSVRARIELVREWLAAEQPDICCLQETKCVDEQFPREELEELGYSIATYGQKTYNGVAILSRRGLEDAVCGLPDEDLASAEARVIRATVEDFMVLNLYVINGQQVGAEKYEHKLAWLARVAEYVRSEFPMTEKVVVCGDFNVTFDDRDVYDPDKWREKILCSTPERDALRQLMQPGLVDLFRAHHEEGEHYTWWDFRTRGFSRNRGLRIDHLLVSPPALEACEAIEIDRDNRAAPKPSDHAPVVATFR